MRLRFTKMHGCGNDFVMIDSISQTVKLSPEKIRYIANRHNGIGCDQLLIVEAPRRPDVDFFYRIYNQDGSEVQNCGNGARCFAKFVRDRRLTAKKTIRVETISGIMTLEVQAGGEISVDMGVPILKPSDIPMLADSQAIKYSIQLDEKSVEVFALSTGNPHAVLLVDDITTAPLQSIGIQLQQHSSFPEGVNVGFMQVLSREEINLRVLERGVGETQACGTGACAAVVAGILDGQLDNNVKVNLPGGSLQINWQEPGASIIKTGPATTVFHGQAFI